MNKRVTLVAAGIQVTAYDQSRALRYLLEDAGEMRREWNYDVLETCDTDEEITGDADEVGIEVDVDVPRGRGERLWTGNARFDVVVDARDDETAFAAARALLAA
jgi:hypothetical protein